jgi:uncharacterized protein YoxC
VVDPLFWLGLSLLLVAVSLTAVFVAALPALRELARAARSAEKLFDTLSRELPPTLESIRLTGMEITDLTDDVSENVRSAGRVVQQIDQSVSGAKKQAKQAQATTRSVFAGVKAAWQVFKRPAPPRRSRSPLSGEASDRLLGSIDPLEVEGKYTPRGSSAQRWEDDLERESYLEETEVSHPITPFSRASSTSHSEANLNPDLSQAAEVKDPYQPEQESSSRDFDDFSKVERASRDMPKS